MELTLGEKMTRLFVLLLILIVVPFVVMAAEVNDSKVTRSDEKTVVASYKDPSLGMEFIHIQGGCYQMGDTFGDGFPSEKPVHEVCVNDFALAKYDVTVGEFRTFTVATGYKTEAEEKGGCGVFNGSKWEWDATRNWRNPGFNQDDSQPVVCVSWNDAGAFVSWFSKVSGKRCRLPTEAEWEYAARSGGKKEKYAGGNDINALAWYHDNDGNNTHPVGTKEPNGLGLYDMSGNVLQWVQDWYDENYYSDSIRSNPQGPLSGNEKVLRGSAWSDASAYVRAARRSRKAPSHRGSLLGFRLAFSSR
jgi:formylglycine-generating enzyme